MEPTAGGKTKREKDSEERGKKIIQINILWVLVESNAGRLR
jgi:hypothetical protein